MVMYDDLGKSAMTAIEKQMAEEKNHEMLQGIWEKIILEETECATELRNHSYGKEV